MTQQAVVTTRRARYLNAYQTNDERVKVSRPTLLDLPYTLLASIFIYSQSSSLLRCCSAFASIAYDPYIRAQYLEFKYRHRQGSFFVQVLRDCPPAENTALWKVLRNRKMLSGSHDRDIYREMKKKEKSVHADVAFWEIYPSSRPILFNWMRECCEDFSWSHTTRYLACTILDRFLCSSDTPLCDDMQLFAAACLSLAAKSDESINLVPAALMAEVAQTTPRRLLLAELQISTTLNWVLVTLPTPEIFLSYYICTLNISSKKKFIVHRQPGADSSSSTTTRRGVSVCATTINSIVNAPAFYVHEDERYLVALQHLDTVYQQHVCTASLLPSKLAALCLWWASHERGACKLSAAEFEACTEYTVAEMSQLDLVMQARLSPVVGASQQSPAQTT